MDRHSDHRGFCAGSSFRNRSAKACQASSFFIAAAERAGADGVCWIRNAALIFVSDTGDRRADNDVFRPSDTSRHVQRAIAVVVITFATSAAAIANLISGT